MEGPVSRCRRPPRHIRADMVLGSYSPKPSWHVVVGPYLLAFLGCELHTLEGLGDAMDMKMPWT